MKLAKSAVTYYTDVTGNPWSKFYDDLDEAMASDITTQTGDLWLIHSLMNVIIASGLSVNEFKVNKDAVKAAFDEEGRKLAGEFFTPILWAEELHNYMDKYIPNWRETYNVWEGSCYSMDTEILTQRGWVLYDDLRDDDLIYTLNPNTLEGEWSGFHSRFKKPYKGKMVSFKGVDIDLCVTPEHKMFCLQRTNSRTKRQPVDIEAIKIYDKYQNLSDSSKIATYKVVTSAKSIENYMYDSVKADSVLSNITKLNDFWYLIGLFIGDGGYYVNNSGTINALKFSYKKSKKIVATQTVLDLLGIDYTIYDYRDKEDGKLTFRVNDSCLLDFIRNYVGFGFSNKRIPFELIDVKYLLPLFLGLIDTDGTVVDFYENSYMNTNSYRYWSANEELIDDICTLCTLLGKHYKKSSRVRKSASSDKLVTEYSLNISGKTDFGLTKKNTELVDYDDYVWDLTTNNDNHIFYVRRNGKAVFSKNCGSGNLIRTAGIVPDHLFASSLQDDDITLIRNTPELQGCHAFQLDFLSAVDNPNNFMEEFTTKLPEELQRVFKNNEPIVFLMNPPYKTGQANNTEVGRYMNGANPFYNNVDFAKPAYDLFYQFCFQVMNIVSYYKLTNCYYAVFGPLTWFTGAGANILLKEFEKTFEFVDGMCISAQEFSDTSDSILWGIGATIWKSRGGYDLMPAGFQYHKDILLDKKFIAPDGTIGCEGKVLYAPPREKLSTWVAPHDGAPSEDAPLMTSHLTFKGSDVFEKVAPKSAKIQVNALGTLMVGNTLTRSADQSAILSMPSTISYVSITEENFWRCVGSYAFRRTIDAGWAIAKKEISAPDTTVEGYDIWLRNAIPLVLFEYKSMMSSMRNVDWNKQLTNTGVGYNIYNKLFYLTEDEIRANCHDEVILRDLEEHPLQNQFMLKVIAESEPYWAPEVRQLYDWCKNYTLATYDLRKTVNYKGSLECADAGFQQLRAGLWDAEKLDNDMTKLLVQARDFMRRDISKFGFVSEVQGADL